MGLQDAVNTTYERCGVNMWHPPPVCLIEMM